MRGVQFLVDEAGKAKSVLIDLDVWEDVWEDIYDVMIAREREHEEDIPWEVVRAEIEQELPKEKELHGDLPSSGEALRSS